jgi:hypothetical protein
MTSLTVMVFTFGRTGNSTRATGKMASSMGRESRRFLTVLFLMESGTRDAQSDRVSASTRMARNTQEAG